MRSLPSKHHSRRGTALLAIMSIIVIIVGFSFVLMKSSVNNVIDFRQDRREAQAGYVAESALSLAIAKMNNDWLTTTGYPHVGSMSDPADDFVVHSGDSGHAPIQVRKSGLRGHPNFDGIDNDQDGNIVDDPADNHLVDETEDEVLAGGYYKGGIYRVRVREWVKSDSGKGEIGAEKMDDDADGDVDEAGEVNGYTTETSRQFTLKIEASYGNYAIDMSARTNANQTSADKFGIYSEGNLTLKSKAYVDSYDSSLGAYGGANKSKHGNVGSESDLTLKSNADVYGDGKYGGTLTNKGTIHGDTGSLSDDRNNKVWTLSRDFLFPSDVKTVASGTTETITSNYKRLEIKKNGKAVIPKDTTITFGENGSGNPGITSLGSGAEVEIGSGSDVFIEESWIDGSDTRIVIRGPDSDGGEPTEIYVADSFETNNSTDIVIDGRVELKVVDEFDIGSKSTVDVTSGETTDFSVMVGGNWLSGDGSTTLESSPGSELRIKPKSDWMGVLFAPDVLDAQLYPKGDYFGVLTAQNVDMKSKFRFHYDETIADSCALDSVTCAWLADNSNAWIVNQRGSGPVIY